MKFNIKLEKGINNYAVTVLFNGLIEVLMFGKYIEIREAGLTILRGIKGARLRKEIGRLT